MLLGVKKCGEAQCLIIQGKNATKKFLINLVSSSQELQEMSKGNMLSTWLPPLPCSSPSPEHIKSSMPTAEILKLTKAQGNQSMEFLMHSGL